MRRKLSAIFIIFLLFFTTSCNKEIVENVKKKDEFSIDVAETVVEDYLKSVMLGDLENSNKLLEDSIKTNTIVENNNSISINGFRIEETNESNDSVFFTVKVSQQDKESCNALLWNYLIKVRKTNMEYKIQEINNSLFREVINFKDSLRIRFQNSVDTNLLLDMDGIGNYTYSKDDKGKLSMQSIPNSEFSITAISYGAQLIAITTEDENAFIGIVSVDETIQTQGESTDASDDETSKGIKIKEKPMGKTLVSCDWLKNSIVTKTAFSLDEKYLVAQYSTIEGNICFRVYSSESGEMIKIKLEEEFPLNSVDIEFDDFEEGAINFSVKDKNGADPKYLGQWGINLREMMLEKKN